MTKTIRTFQDARNEKNAMDARLFAKMDAREAAQKEVAAVLAANPQIGTLIRNGKPVYYSFTNGYRESRDPKALA